MLSNILKGTILHVWNRLKSIQTKFNPYPFIYFFPPAAVVYCFNSQEKQLKAGRGLTYTQWSKIDERHPAWTNHSTEGEASQQTWKVQEAMTGLMVWKMLLMNEEGRLWLSLPSFIYHASGHHHNSSTLILKLFCLAWRMVGWIDGFKFPSEREILLLHTQSSLPIKYFLACRR